MTLPELSVRRPTLAAVIAIMLCVVGTAAFLRAPLSEFPNVDPPQVSITTAYTGASAEVVEERVTQVIEQEIAGIQGIDRITSSSRDGRSLIGVGFALDRNIDQAASDVRDAVSRAASRLPEQAEPPQITKANADAPALIFVTLTSNLMSRVELSDYANRYLIQRMATIPGIAQAKMVGGQAYAMRVWLDPDAMAARGLTVEDVQSALNAQNLELPAGALESGVRDVPIKVNRGYARASDFARLPVVPGGGLNRLGGIAAAATANLEGVTNHAGVSSSYITRLGDIAHIEEGPDERRRMFMQNGVEQLGIGMVRQSQANDLQIAAAVGKQVKQINATLPKGMQLKMAVDWTAYTRDAIREVLITMALSLGLVAIVNFLFLGSWRAAIVPTIVAPICMIAAFIALSPLGFSVNLMTLLALVLAIGLVTCDAIIVVENIQRRMDEGEQPVVAAERGANQVFFAVIATTTTLIMVFAPLMFLPGYVGRLFVELAVAVAAAVFFSALLALSLTPMLSSRLLRPKASAGWLQRQVDDTLDALDRSYRSGLAILLSSRGAAGLTGVAVVVLTLSVGMLFLIIPKEFVPPEDRGRLDIQVQAPEGSGYDYTLRGALKAKPYLDRLRVKGEVTDYVIGVPRFNQNQFNGGFGNVVLAPWRNRTVTSQQLAAELNREWSRITSVRVIATVRGAVQQQAGSSGSNVDLIAEGDEYPAIAGWLEPIYRAAQANPGLVRPRLDYEPNSPRLIVNLDRERAAALGVSPEAIGRVLQVMFGSQRVTTYIKNGQEYDVVLQTDLDRRRTVEDLNTLYVRGSSGELIPLANVVKTEMRGDTPDRRRTDRQRSITLTAELAPGYTVAQAVEFYRQEAARRPSRGIVVAWGGQARDYLQASGAVAIVFGVALLLVFLVLAAQFENWIHPAIIMLTAPLAVVGGLAGLLLSGSSINTYSEIGLIILIGIGAKNGILIVEFANQLRDQGRSVTEAVLDAVQIRLRPILMTSVAAAVGALPLVLAAGPGAGSRNSIGIVVFAGSISSAALTLVVVPVFYNLLGRFTKTPKWTARLIDAFEAREPVKSGSPPLSPVAAEAAEHPVRP
jgi:multidrug efflux pump